MLDESACLRTHMLVSMGLGGEILALVILLVLRRVKQRTDLRANTVERTLPANDGISRAADADCAHAAPFGR